MTIRKDRWSLRFGWIGLIYIIIAVISLWMLFDFLEKRMYYCNSDAFYYMSLADSLRQDGCLRDITTCPSAPPISPQNAIVIIFYFLNLFVSGPDQSLIILVLINYLALLFSIYPLLKITERLGMLQIPVRLALIFVYLCGWHMIRFQLSPITGGLFSTTSLWLIYAMIRLSERDVTWKELFNSRKVLLVATCILSAVLIHFRLNALVIPVAAFFSAVLVKRYSVAFLMLVCAVIMVLSLIAPYFFVDLERIQSVSEKSLNGMVHKHRVAQRVWELAEVIPACLFRNLGTCGNMLYAAFPLAILVEFIDSVRKKNFAIIFIVLVCMGTFGFLLMLYAVRCRMLLMVYPLLYLILLRKPSFRPIGYLFVFAVVTQSFFHFQEDFKLPDKVEFWSYLSTNLETNKSDYVLITEEPRQAYYFTNMRGFGGEYTTQCFEGKKIYLAGSQDYRKAEKLELENYLHEKGYRAEYINLTEEYQDSTGHAFLRVKLSRRSP